MTMNGITTMRRISTGMFLSDIAMIFTAIVETKRLESEPETITIFWLLPQYILLGVSDIFTVVGMQEFFLQCSAGGDEDDRDSSLFKRVWRRELFERVNGVFG
ncbi:putative proton-dependent oligopeptide transporter family, MFS transporter superfamily [Helianthus debilis subsp. tardiflorus]